MFCQPEDFPFTFELEANWRKIRSEYTAVRSDLIPWHERDLHDDGWQTYSLYAIPGGEPIREHVEHCPFTAGIIAKYIPGRGAAGFSAMDPHSAIRTHEGYPGEVLRCHLGLIVPPGDCAIRVGSEQRRWEEGKCLVFNDRVEHEAWNRTSGARVVLLIDFVPHILK